MGAIGAIDNAAAAAQCSYITVCRSAVWTQGSAVAMVISERLQGDRN